MSGRENSFGLKKSNFEVSPQNGKLWPRNTMGENYFDFSYLHLGKNKSFLAAFFSADSHLLTGFSNITVF